MGSALRLGAVAPILQYRRIPLGAFLCQKPTPWSPIAQFLIHKNSPPTRSLRTAATHCVAAAASTAAAAAASVAAAAAAASDKLKAARGQCAVFPVEDIERRQTDVEDFFLTEGEFVTRGIVG